jgi:hypothetical protein
VNVMLTGGRARTSPTRRSPPMRRTWTVPRRRRSTRSPSATQTA